MTVRPYTRLVSSVLFPAHELIKGHHTTAVLRALEESQWWDPERLRELQSERLRALLRHAGTNVPYYRSLFEEIGISPEEVSTVDDLPRIPLLSKDLMRAHAPELRSERAGRLTRLNTGGSSGQPLVFYIGVGRVSHDVAAKWRVYRWWGVEIGDPEVVVWGSPIELGAQDRLRNLRDRVLRSRLLPAFDMSPANLDRFVGLLRKWRPRILFGYPSALALIARHATRSGADMSSLGTRVAFVTAERLYPDQATAIREVFGCRVGNGYGGRDSGYVAHECPEGGMHISAEDIIVEIVDASGRVLPPGSQGEIVVTHLDSSEYPFIRYRTGDVAVLDSRPCTCGRGLPLIREIQGRSTDFVVTSDGTIMHGLALIYVLRDLPGISAFKIIQESILRIRVEVVPEQGYSDNVRASIVAGLKARLGQAVEVAVESVREIPPEKSGKFRYVVSNVGSAAGQAG
jgi:phenylacetate-CoA ligase